MGSLPQTGAEAKPGETMGGEPEKKEEPKGFRFKSQEDAEKAHGEAERTMTQAKMEAAEERKAREKLEQELADLRAKPPETKVEEPVKPVETKDERRTKLLGVAKAATSEALKKIDELDASDPDYEDKRAAIWAEKDAKALENILETIGTASLTREEVSLIAKEQVKAEREAAAAERAKTDATTNAEKAWQSAVEFGAKAGLNLEDAESADHDLFMMAETKLPEELKGKGFTPEVGTWMVNYVRTRTGKVVLTEAEKEAAALKVQQENQVLGKGGVRPKPQPKQETEGSLASDFEDARKQRIL